MQLHTTDTICALTGTHPANLKRWMRQGLLARTLQNEGWSDDQLNEIHDLVALTATGATLKEIKRDKALHRPVSTSGWHARKGDMLWELEYGTPLSLSRKMRDMSNDYSGDDLVFQLLCPLNQWLHADHRQGSSRRLARFEQSVRQQAGIVMRASSRRGETAPLFLEAVSVQSVSEIWLEAIRLTAMGFHVEVSTLMSGQPAAKPAQHQHHVMWCGAGISKAMNQYFDNERAAGKAVMLSGPDKNLRYSFNSLPANTWQSGAA